MMTYPICVSTLVILHKHCILNFPQCYKIAFSVIRSVLLTIRHPQAVAHKQYTCIFPSLGYCNNNPDVTTDFTEGSKLFYLVLQNFSFKISLQSYATIWEHKCDLHVLL